MASSITPPRPGRTQSPSPGEGSTSPAGTHTQPCNLQSFRWLSWRLIPPSLLLLSSPIEVKIGSEAGPQKVRAWGPGLEGGVVGKSADFVVEAVGDNVGTLGENRSSSH